jgi:hypothetical protein
MHYAFSFYHYIKPAEEDATSPIFLSDFISNSSRHTSNLGTTNQIKLKLLYLRAVM